MAARIGRPILLLARSVLPGIAITGLLAGVIALHLSQGQPLPWSTSTDSVSLSQAGTSADPVASTSISPLLVHAREVGTAIPIPTDTGSVGSAETNGSASHGRSGQESEDVSDRRAAVLAAIEREFPAHWREWAGRVIDCESGGVGYDPAAVGAHGERGVAQVLERFHGPVPADIEGQVAQMARIHREKGAGEWTCR